MRPPLAHTAPLGPLAKGTHLWADKSPLGAWFGKQNGAGFQPLLRQTPCAVALFAVQKI